MKVSKFDSVMDATESFELGHMIKHLSIKKANRDMKTFIPNYDESSEFQKYLRSLDQVEKDNDETTEVTPMK